MSIFSLEIPAIKHLFIDFQSQNTSNKTSFYVHFQFQKTSNKTPFYVDFQFQNTPHPHMSIMTASFDVHPTNCYRLPVSKYTTSKPLLCASASLLHRQKLIYIDIQSLTLQSVHRPPLAILNTPITHTVLIMIIITTVKKTVRDETDMNFVTM